MRRFDGFCFALTFVSMIVALGATPALASEGDEQPARQGAVAAAAERDAGTRAEIPGQTSAPRLKREQGIETRAIYTPPAPPSGAPSVRTGGATRGGPL